jgi:putative restriction endonuclease
MTSTVSSATDPKALARKWLAKLSDLNPAAGHGQCKGKAPHKPLLLLCLLDLVEAGEVRSRNLTRTPSLVLRFMSYGSLVADRWPTRLDIRLPFFHLSRQDFWGPMTADRAPATSPESTTVCEIHPEFFQLLSDPTFRTDARMLLLSRYFQPAEREGLLESMGIPVEARPAAKLRMQQVESEALAAAKRKGRSARFAIQVVSRYKFTCALTGLSCITADGATIVDAAHIEQWSTSQNDDLTNGLALCKSAHWMFDEGLWSVADNGTVLVAADRFKESGPGDLRLAAYVGRSLQFPAAASLRPSAESLRRHRRHHGFGL